MCEGIVMLYNQSLYIYAVITATYLPYVTNLKLDCIQIIHILFYLYHLFLAQKSRKYDILKIILLPLRF